MKWGIDAAVRWWPTAKQAEKVTCLHHDVSDRFIHFHPLDLTDVAPGMVDNLRPILPTDPHYPGGLNRTGGVPYSHADIIRQPNHSPMRQGGVLGRLESPNGKKLNSS